MIMIKMLMYYFASEQQLLVALPFRANIFRAQFESYINEFKTKSSISTVSYTFSSGTKSYDILCL